MNLICLTMILIGIDKMRKFNVYFMFYNKIYQTIERAGVNTVNSMEQTFINWESKGDGFTVKIIEVENTQVIGI